MKRLSFYWWGIAATLSVALIAIRSFSNTQHAETARSPEERSTERKIDFKPRMPTRREFCTDPYKALCELGGADKMEHYLDQQEEQTDDYFRKKIASPAADSVYEAGYLDRMLEAADRKNFKADEWFPLKTDRGRVVSRNLSNYTNFVAKLYEGVAKEGVALDDIVVDKRSDATIFPEIQRSVERAMLWDQPELLQGPTTEIMKKGMKHVRFVYSNAGLRALKSEIDGLSLSRDKRRDIWFNFLDLFQDECGKGGQTQGMAHMHLDDCPFGIVYICPANLLHMRDRAKGRMRIGAIVEGFGHEIGHANDSGKMKDRAKELAKQEAIRLRELRAKPLDQLTMSEYRELENAKHFTPQSERLQTFYDPLGDCLKKNEKVYGKPGKRKLERYMAETTADLSAAETVARYGTDRMKTEEEKMQFIVDAFQDECFTTEEENPAEDDDLHPNGAFRVRFLCYNPRVRKMAGCSDEAKGVNACALEGEVTL